MSVSNITVNWMNRFSCNFQDRSGMTQRTFWDMLRLIPCIQDLFSYFADLCLLATLRNNRWMNIHGNFTPEKTVSRFSNNARLRFALLECFLLGNGFVTV